MIQMEPRKNRLDDPELVRMVIGPWNPMTTRPLHDGEYELRRRDGAAADRGMCRDRSWVVPVDEYDAWRGRVLPFTLAQRSPAKTLRRVRQRLVEYRGGVPMTHAVAAKAALWLARVSVARNAGFDAYRNYLILAKVQPSAMTELDAAWQARFTQHHLHDPRLVK